MRRPGVCRCQSAGGRGHATGGEPNRWRAPDRGDAGRQAHSGSTGGGPVPSATGDSVGEVDAAVGSDDPAAVELLLAADDDDALELVDAALDDVGASLVVSGASLVVSGASLVVSGAVVSAPPVSGAYAPSAK